MASRNNNNNNHNDQNRNHANSPSFTPEDLVENPPFLVAVPIDGEASPNLIHAQSWEEEGQEPRAVVNEAEQQAVIPLVPAVRIDGGRRFADENLQRQLQTGVVINPIDATAYRFYGQHQQQRGGAHDVSDSDSDSSMEEISSSFSSKLRTH